MSICRACGSENSPEVTVCAICGAPLNNEAVADIVPTEVEASKATEATEVTAVNPEEVAPKEEVSVPAKADQRTAADLEFEKESQIVLSKDKLTYICDFCGKVNSISASQCSRCGKRRPRSEYIKAMQSIKASESVKNDFAAEQAVRVAEQQKDIERAEARAAQLEDNKRKAQNMAMVRLIEERVADEKSRMAVAENARVAKVIDDTRRESAKEAATRLIALERAADDRVAAYEQDNAEVKKQTEQQIAEEREKSLRIAAERLAAERTNLERQTLETIMREKQAAEATADERVEAERAEAEKMAARRAVLQVIAAEKAADDKVKVTKEAYEQAARQRIYEERANANDAIRQERNAAERAIEEARLLSEKKANAIRLAERQAVEDAANQRIAEERAENEKLVKALSDGDAYSREVWGQQRRVNASLWENQRKLLAERKLAEEELERKITELSLQKDSLTAEYQARFDALRDEKIQSETIVNGRQRDLEETWKSQRLANQQLWENQQKLLAEKQALEVKFDEKIAELKAEKDELSKQKDELVKAVEEKFNETESIRLTANKALDDRQSRMDKVVLEQKTVNQQLWDNQKKLLAEKQALEAETQRKIDAVLAEKKEAELEMQRKMDALLLDRAALEARLNDRISGLDAAAVRSGRVLEDRQYQSEEVWKQQKQVNQQLWENQQKLVAEKKALEEETQRKIDTLLADRAALEAKLNDRIAGLDTVAVRSSRVFDDRQSQNEEVWRQQKLVNQQLWENQQKLIAEKKALEELTEKRIRELEEQTEKRLRDERSEKDRIGKLLEERQDFADEIWRQQRLVNQQLWENQQKLSVKGSGDLMPAKAAQPGQPNPFQSTPNCPNPIPEVPQGDAQNKQVIQPFVVVPYVNQNQPVYQYKPNQVYRFVPNSYEQAQQAKAKAENDMEVLANGPQPTEEELAKIYEKKLQKKAEIDAELKVFEDAKKEEEKALGIPNKKKRNVRICSLISLLIIIGMGIAVWLAPLTNVFVAANVNLSILKGFGGLIERGINEIFSTNLAIIGGSEYLSYIEGAGTMAGVVLPLGLFFVIINYLVALVVSIVRLIKGTAKTKGLFLAILGFVLVQVILLGAFLILPKGATFSLQIGVYVLEGLALAALIVALCLKPYAGEKK